MKKSLFIMALGAIALTSCSQDEVLEVKQDAIAFSAITENASRATASTTLDKFKVYAYVTEDATTKTYINGLEATKTGEAWTLANGYYWPANAVDFYCVSNPVEGVDAGSLVLNASHQVENYTVASNHTNDLLYSVLKGAEKDSYSDGVATLNFRHALAMVQFQVKSLATYGLDVKVTNIALKNVKTSGTYTLPEYTTSPWLDSEDETAEDRNEVDNGNGEADDTNEYRTRGSWSLGAPVTDAYSWSVGSLNALASTNSGDQTSSASDPFFLMPQKFTPATPTTGAWSGTYFVITANVTKNEVLLHSGDIWIPAAAVGAEKEWKEGYKYLYTLTFGQGAGYQPGTDDAVVIPISFSVTVDLFQNATEGVQVQEPAEGVVVTP